MTFDKSVPLRQQITYYYEPFKLVEAPKSTLAELEDMLINKCEDMSVDTFNFLCEVNYAISEILKNSDKIGDSKGEAGPYDEYFEFDENEFDKEYRKGYDSLDTSVYLLESIFEEYLESNKTFSMKSANQIIEVKNLLLNILKFNGFDTISKYLFYDVLLLRAYFNYSDISFPKSNGVYTFNEAIYSEALIGIGESLKVKVNREEFIYGDITKDFLVKAVSNDCVDSDSFMSNFYLKYSYDLIKNLIMVSNK